MSRSHDILVLADLRFPGGTSTAIAAEIEAQARAGHRTGLVALKAPVLRFPHPIHPEIKAQIAAGRAELLDPETPVSAGLVLIHHPQVLTHLPRVPLGIAAEHALLVAHHPPFDAEGSPFYDWRRIDRNAAALFGRRVPWAPVGPAVRRQLAALPDGPALWAADWHNVLDPDAWRVARGPAPRTVPVIGRHSRPDLLKWPATREEALRIYSAAPGAVAVRILGGDAAVAAFLEPLPAHWELLPFGSVPPRAFLASLDTYVYFHHPRWVEAFGRTVLEAMAAGLPVVLPASFRELFGAAALYAEPAEVQAVLRALHADPAAWRAAGERARTAVAERFSLARHAQRVADVIGRPTAGGPPRPRRPRTVLFFTSNGIGLGHVTRALAIAKRCGPGIEPVFVTLSQGARLIEEAGFAVQYLPFHAYLGADVNRWNQHLAAELGEAIRFYDPSVVLFDGNTPYAGFVQALQKAERAWAVWVRRGFWRPGSGAAALEREGAFDAVIEPEDLAEILDEGPTTQQRGRTRRVAPIRLVDGAELLPREAARRALDLPGAGTCVLLQLGAGNNYDFAGLQERAIALLSRVPGLTLAALESPIALEPPSDGNGVRRLRLFPAGRYVRAFDFVVSAVGYNSYHELLLSGTPALFVPNEHPMMDDQRARAEHAERMGWSLALRTDDIYRLGAKLDRLLDPGEREAMRRRMALLPQRNGAEEAAEIVREMALTVRADRAG
ncbi:glycosyltransferase [Benzoatithermus flavus]|uniref:Glycosyltransferase n=1 Tax=Benzoatithermus flavus TaxID=3108223 RepID=A0ABU8XRP3_9PROT